MADNIESLATALRVESEVATQYARQVAYWIGKHDDMKAQRDELLAALEDAQDIASKALRKAWQLGQTYWQQADSEYISQHRKADETQANFQKLVDETRAAITKVEGGK